GVGTICASSLAIAEGLGDTSTWLVSRGLGVRAGSVALGVEPWLGAVGALDSGDGLEDLIPAWPSSARRFVSVGVATYGINPSCCEVLGVSIAVLSSSGAATAWEERASCAPSTEMRMRRRNFGVKSSDQYVSAARRVLTPIMYVMA